MKKIKLTITALSVLSVALGVYATERKSMVDDASTVFGASTPNISLEEKGTTWDCEDEPAESACYYTLDEETGLYTVESPENGQFYIIP